MVRQGADRGKLKERAHDLYETPPEATRALIRTGCLNGYRVIYEPCAGRGAISRELKTAGFQVVAQELVEYPGADADVHAGIDFFDSEIAAPWNDAIVTNPPFREGDRFIRHGLRLGLPVFVLLRLMALEGAGRSDLMQHLRHVFIGIERLPKFQREGWKGKRLKVETAPFAWFCFLPQKGDGVFTCSRISWREEVKPCPESLMLPSSESEPKDIPSQALSP